MRDDTISRAAAINALGEEPPVWYDGEDEIAERDQWRRDVAAIEALPPARPVEDARAMCGECDAWNQYKNYPQPGWIPCTTETMPKNKSNVLTVIYIPGRQAHIRSGWYEDGLFMNDNGDTWKATDKEVVGWMYQPKLPTPYREGGQE